MTRRPTPLRTRATALGYAIFYRLPQRVRLQLVRLAAPTYTIGAVTLLRDADCDPPGRLLLLRQPPGRGWSLPGGLLGYGEPPADGARRELYEETGIRLAAHEIAPAVPNAVVHTRGRWVDMVFDAVVSAGAIEPRVDGAEVYEAAWHPVDNLPKLTLATARLLAHYSLGPEADGGPSGAAG
ncbi:MAG TPA: NUDIX hydrolase [Micromonosporaceae bacterium]|nr:NUDIX hydrolase [Micromonosporaceae bacterium]